MFVRTSVPLFFVRASFFLFILLAVRRLSLLAVRRLSLFPHAVRMLSLLAVRRLRHRFYQSIRAADTAGSSNAVRRRRHSKQASGKQSLSVVPPKLYHSGVPSRKQVITICPVPRASQNNSIRSLSLRDLALMNLQ